MQQHQQSSKVQLANPTSSFGSSGYSHSTPSSLGSLIQGPGPGSSASSHSNLNMQSHQGEPGTDIIMFTLLHCWNLALCGIISLKQEPEKVSELR